MVYLHCVSKTGRKTKQIFISFSVSIYLFLDRPVLKPASIETLMDGFPEISGFPTQPVEDTRSMAA